jgi:hypothetical protein
MQMASRSCPRIINQDVCKDNDFELPLKIGEFKTAAVTGGCTHAAGEPIMIESHALVGKGSLNGKLQAEVVAKDKAGNALLPKYALQGRRRSNSSAPDRCLVASKIIFEG